MRKDDLKGTLEMQPAQGDGGEYVLSKGEG